tara:strand:- start:1115 stop:1372 length:258 start_codon:yes stop_codon:yes gene_type:complete
MFTLYEDPGHAWLKVPRKMLGELGIANKVSKYSYQSFDFVYLEEDCDAALFFEAYEKEHGSKPKFQTSVARSRQSRIRKYKQYSV